MLVCIRHSKYDGSTSPVLSCKTCCGIFLAALKAGKYDKPQSEKAVFPNLNSLLEETKRIDF